MRNLRSYLLCGVAATALLAVPAATATAQDRHFNRIATLPVYTTLAPGTDMKTTTAAEIISASEDGRTLIFTDSPGDALVFVDATIPSAPAPMGRIALGGEPTSVSVAKSHALTGVNTSKSYKEPGGHLAVVDIQTQKITKTCDVKGQPDSVAVSPDRRYVAIAIENERDEDLNDGAIPQMPAGHLAVFDLDANGQPTNCDNARIVAMTGLAAEAGDDPEPEFVSINKQNVAVVTLQENNHIALVDLASGKIVNHFSAGASSADRIPTNKKRLIDGTGSIKDVPREPDAVAWLDNDRFVTANEGDYKGGSRGFTIFNTKGEVLFDSGASFEHLAMMHGHYPAKRASKKGAEPEGVTVGRFDGETYIFVNAERANFVGVYRDTGAAPEFVQFLPTHIGPEGSVALPERDLFVVANEEDSAEDGVRAMVGIYRLDAGMPAYPTIVSEKDAKTGAPIGWGALSGMAGDPEDKNIVFAVGDSYYDMARIYKIDVSSMPAKIVSYVDLSGGAAKKYDLEGIAKRKAGGYWVASEGDTREGRELDHLLIHVDNDGKVVKEISLPKALRDNAERYSFEGVAEFEKNGETQVVVAIQREWKDDPKGMVKLGVYSPKSDSWGFVHYPLDKPRSKSGGWVGLSEITHIGDGSFAIIERDNKGGPDAAIKQITTISLADVTPAPIGGELPVIEKHMVLDLLPAMSSGHGWTPDKVEGLAVTADGRLLAVTDNDGIDDATGETLLMDLGSVKRLM